MEGAGMRGILIYPAQAVYVATQTFQDLLRERILYNIFFVSLFLLFFGYLAALLVFGHQDRVMLHFGIMINALSIFFVAAGAGARMLRTEVEQRVAYLPLSRPVSRVSYFFGKWIGIAGFCALNLFLLSGVLLIALRVTGGGLNEALVQATVLIWCESLMVSAVALMLSLFFRQGLAVMISMAYLFLSHNHDQIEFLRKQAGESSLLFSLLKRLTPNGQVMLMDTRVYYDIALGDFEMFQRIAYGLAWALLFMLIGNAVFYRKNL
jgi:ABC-type transport system involved in multi-copper enzyme maturation permease subunit